MSFDGNARSNASRSRSHSSRSSSSSSSSSSSGRSSNNFSGGSFHSPSGYGRNTSGGLGMGGGSFHGSSMSLGGGQTAHESFSHSVGSSYGGRSQSERRTSKAIESHTFSQQAATTDYGFKSPSKVGGLSGEGTLTDMWNSVKDMFSDTVTPTGAYAGYGFQQESYSQTPFSERSYSEQWAEDKMATIGNLMKNPMVSAGMWATGLGAVNVGAQVASTIKDMVEGDIDTTKGLGRLASTAISSTPLGESLGAFRGIAGAAVEDISKVPSAIAGTIGGRVGGMLGGSLGEALGGGNMYASAIASTLGAVGLSVAARKGVQEAMSQGPSQQPTAPVRSMSDSRRSPLVDSGDMAIAKSEQMRTQDPDVTKYSRTINLDVPMYGSFYSPNVNLPMYGLS